MRKIAKKAWLNRNGYHSIGMVSLTVSPKYDEIMLTIGDCSRSITLDFSPFEGDKKRKKGEIKNSRYKLAKLREYLDTVEKAIDDMEARLDEA